MTQGIYIHANDAYTDDAIALLNSLRRCGSRYPVCLIPYDDRHKGIARHLQKDFGVQILAEPELFALYEGYAQLILGRPAPMFRKFAMWSGPFDQFLYFDVDIVVFHNPDDIFSLLNTYDFAYFREGQPEGVQEVFTPRVFERGIFSPAKVAEVFNAGFFASNKRTFTQEQIIGLLDEAVDIADIFNRKTQDQPLMNYLVLRAVTNKVDLRRLRPSIPQDAWVGAPELKVIGDSAYQLVNGNLAAVRHLHWTGCRPGLGTLVRRPYRSLWLQYRFPGQWGRVRRLLAVAAWEARRGVKRALAMHMPGWYKPTFQWNRLRRKLATLRIGSATIE